MKRSVTFFKLADWGLNLVGLAKLENRPVRLKAYVRYSREASLFKLPPDDRRAAIWKARAREYRALADWWPNSDYKLIGRRQAPSGVEGVLPARLVPKLRSLPVSAVWIHDIAGRRAKRVERPRPELFSVKARFAIQVEAQTTGMQRYEDRIVVIKADSADDAIAKLRKPFAKYGTPSLNAQGFMVRWAFERVLDVFYSIDEERLDPAGTEVFSDLKWRRMRPEYAWKPNRRRR